MFEQVLRSLFLLLVTVSIYGLAQRIAAMSSLINEDEDLTGSLVAFDTSTENYTVPVSGKCVLTCYVAEVRSFKVLWQKIDRPNNLVGNQTHGQEQPTLIAFDGVVYSNKDHYRLESDYVGSYNLIIDRVNEDDQGEYQCQINTEPRKTKRIFLTVQVPPRIVEFRPNPPLISIEAGTTLTLSCRAEGTPTPQIRWRIRDPDGNQRVNSLPPDNSNTWLIPAITNTFPRTVECIADNGVLPGSNRIFTINIEYPPVVSVPQKHYFVSHSENVTLECFAISRPFARLFWEKNGQLIDENRMSHTRVNQTMSSSRLTIQMNTNDDFGQYNCVAENLHGRMEENVIVEHEIVMSTTEKMHRHSKFHSSRTNAHRLTTGRSRSATTIIIRSSTASNMERDISISSSSNRFWTSNRSLFVWLIFLFRRTIER